MAFPTVTISQETAVTGMSTGHTIGLGATWNANDGILMIVTGSQVGADETYTITTPSGFTLVGATNQWNVGGENRQHTGVYIKVATGSEDGTNVTVTTSAAVSMAAQVFRITAGTWAEDTAGIALSTFTEVEAANPNPPSFTHGFGAVDVHFVVVATSEDSDFEATGAPASYSSLNSIIADGTEDAVISTAHRDNAIATEDPGAWTCASEKWQAFTIAIEPAGGGGGGDPDSGDWYLQTDDTDFWQLTDDTDWYALNATPITGTAAVTLGAATSTASGTFTPAPITGTVAVTLAAKTSAASGTFTPPPITGTAAITLAPKTSTASGILGFIGTATPTLAPLISTATGIHDSGFTGSAAVILQALISAGSGTFTPAPATGSAAVTLGLLVSTASGTFTPPPITGTADVTLAPLVSAAAGSVTFNIDGSVAVTLAALLSEGVGVFYTTNVPQGGIVSGGSLGSGSNTAGGGGQSRAGGTSGIPKVDDA